MMTPGGCRCEPFQMLREGTRACFTSGPICRKTKAAPVKQSGPGELMSYSEDLHSAALAYHRLPRPGKLEIQAIKPLANQRDLALAYSPGVAAACTEIAQNPSEAASLTARANLVAVVSNGTAVLGLGNIGPLASKPVMEGKAVLFKKFAGIDVFDIEIAAKEIERMVEVVAALEPTFGGINLEDIKAPECFYIEKKLRERMKIPVFHDDQQGTAIVTAAAVLNALKIAINMTALAAPTPARNARSYGRSTDAECGGRKRRRVDVRTLPRTRRRQDGPLASAWGDRDQARADAREAGLDSRATLQQPAVSRAEARVARPETAHRL